MKKLVFINILILTTMSVIAADFVEDRDIDFVNDSKSYAFEVTQQGDTTGLMKKFGDFGRLTIPFVKNKDGSRLQSFITINVFKKKNNEITEGPIHKANFQISFDKDFPRTRTIRGAALKRIPEIGIDYSWFKGFSFRDEEESDDVDMKNLGTYYPDDKQGYQLLD